MKGLRYILLFCLLQVAIRLPAAETILLGNVYDAGTGMPLENASVFFRGTKIGTTTDSDGFFYMRLDVLKEVKMTISAVGYRKQVFTILPGASAGMQVLLEERIDNLEEVLATPGVNPADELMRRVRAARKENNRGGVTEGDTQYFVSDIRPSHLKRRLWKNLSAGMLQQTDSTYLLPLPKEAAHLAIPLPEQFDVYQSNIPFHNTAFLSPLAASAPAFYRYYLVDSTVVAYPSGREKHYQVHILPKNTFDPVLQGVLEVDSASFALRKVRLEVPREANVNYLTGLSYNAVYQPDGSRSAEQLAAVMQLSVKADTSHLFPSLLAIRRSHQDGLVPDTLQHADSAMQAFLQASEQSIRMPEIADSLRQASEDSLMLTPLYKVVRWGTELALTGYARTGTPIDIGSVTEILRYTSAEHLHLGLPLRTNEQLFKHVSLGAYVGYGFRDRGVKYGANVEVLLPTERRHLLRFSVSDRYAPTDVSPLDALKSENTLTSENLAFTTYAFEALRHKQAPAESTMARRREAAVVVENDWCASRGTLPAVETTFAIRMGHQGYGNALLYDYYSQPSYRFSSASAMVRLSWRERRADFFTVRHHLYSHYPTVFFYGELTNYTHPVSNRLTMAGRVGFLVRQHLLLGPAGQLTYLVDGGLASSGVPSPMLFCMNGNDGYTYQPTRFTLMPRGTYMYDRYLAAQLHYDMRGLALGRIPGIRYLRLHELFEAKLAYGHCPSGVSVGDFTCHSPFYAEVGVGLGNIFRVGELWSVWRLAPASDPYAPRWGMRFRLHLSL